MATTVDDLPASFDPRNPLCNPQGNGAWSGRYTDQSGEQTVSWLGPFSGFRDFVNAALLRRETVEVQPGTTVERLSPLVCPYDPDLIALEVIPRALTTEEAEEEDAAPWELVVATVRFGIVPYPQAGETPFVSISMNDTPKRTTIPNYAYTLVDDSDVFVEGLSQDVAIPVAEEEITVTWHGLTGLTEFSTATGPLVETVNSVEVTIPQLAITCPIGTLYVAGRSMGLTHLAGNLTRAEASVRLQRRALPWNRAIGSGGTPRWISPRPFASASPAALWRGY